MATKVKTGVIDAGAITSALITDASITADDLHTTLDLTGKTVTVATASASDNDTSVASTAYVTTAIANLADSAPSTLNTLNELAAALGDDANFSTTVTNSIAAKLPLAGGTMTGTLTVAGSSSGTVDALIITNTDTTNNGLSIGVDSSENAFFWNGSNTSMNFATNNTERMRITSTGEIVTGGLTSSTGQLHLYKADATGGKLVLQSQVASDATSKISMMSRLLDNTNKTAYIEAYRGNINFGGESGYGNVGIGTANPLNKFVVAHESHGVAIDYVGTLPSQAGLFTSSTAHTQTAYGDLNIKSRSDYTTYGIGFFTANVANTPTLRMKIDSTGNVDITSGNLFTDTTSGIFFSGGIGSFTNGIYGVGVNNVAIAVGGAQRMIIDSNGTITQNTTSASPVSANFITSNSNCDVTMKSANSASLTRLRNATNDFQVHTNGTHVFTLDANGGSIHQALDMSNKDIGTAPCTENYSNSHFIKRYLFRITADNVWRKVLGSFNDAYGHFDATISDTASGDVALYTYRVTSPAYGVSIFSQTTYTNGGWNTGGFEFRIVAVSNTYQLECRYTSYYSASNTGICYMTIYRGT